MEICITYGGKKHCLFLPIYEYPIVYRPIPHPENYRSLLFDATLVASIQAAASKVTDSRVAAALHTGIEAAIKAMQAHAGEGVEIHAAAPAQG